MNAIHTYGIVTNSLDLARDTLINIAECRGDAGRCSLSMYDMTFNFENGDRWMWIKPRDQSRGYRLHKAMFDKNITFEEFEFIWRQCCGLYCESYEWI